MILILIYAIVHNIIHNLFTIANRGRVFLKLIKVKPLIYEDCYDVHFQQAVISVRYDCKAHGKQS